MAESTPADHTKLTGRNFAGFAGMMLLMEFIIVGMGAVDLLMIAPLGVLHIAALGLGDLVSIAVFSFFVGLVHAYAGRLAVAEGKQELAQRLPVLAGAAALVLLLFQLLGYLIGLGMGPGLDAIGQDAEIVPFVDGYLDIRLNGIIPAILVSAIGVTLRTCGAKTQASAVLVVGFVANIVFNYVFLYTEALGFFASPETGVATATVLAQSLMLPVGAGFLLRLFRKRQERFARPRGSEVVAEFRSLAPTSCGIGARHINDYMSATLPILFIGTMGAGAVAATAVATKVYTLYCRIPQSCFEAAFVFYGYVGGAAKSVLVRRCRTVMAYSGITTAVTTVVVLLCSPWLIMAFAGEGVDRSMAQIMFFAYMISMPGYFFDQLLARFLAVHQRGNVLFSVSILTYVVAIPLAWYSVFVLDSAFLAIASRGVVFVLSALYFRKILRRDYWVEREPQLV
ncbi:MATE family efflux transporter [Streptosporangium sp. NBC_01756]|uniref:MATE family efflux transporter n=1 Tax=Streptosporangium sp. NBC_01756 TaxID=2975950 RepID=UPI002DD834DE|nr:MATE family efflux transporter [Streptosporangium sp. NBC_01756]WSC85289.1 MATE family efflux transporter [Streptosporangium sp. NBC_01756]